MQAIFETGGKQYTAEEGTQLFIEKLDAAADSTVTFDKVLAVLGGKEAVFGAPYITGAAVTAKVLKNGKSKKITVFTYRSKKDSKRKLGHRQPYTKVEITGIAAKGAPAKAAKSEETVTAAAEENKAEKKTTTAKAAAPKKEAAPKAEKKTTAAKAPAAKKEAAPKTAAKTAAKPAAEKKPAAVKKPAAKKTEKES